MKYGLIAALAIATAIPAQADNHYAVQTDEQHKACLDAWNNPLTGILGDKCHKWQEWCRVRGYTKYVNILPSDGRAWSTNGFTGSGLRCVPE